MGATEVCRYSPCLIVLQVQEQKIKGEQISRWEVAGQHTGWMPCEQGPSPHPEEAREDVTERVDVELALEKCRN